MRRLSYAVPALGAATILRSARVGALVLLSTLVLGSPSASALPPASGSKCKSDWVNNAGALACFIQGEEDVRNGVRHPHYVACTNAGEVFCCVDGDTGQNCEAVRAGRGHHLERLQLGALLEGQQTVLRNLSQIVGLLNDLKATIAEPSLFST